MKTNLNLSYVSLHKFTSTAKKVKSNGKAQLIMLLLLFVSFMHSKAQFTTATGSPYIASIASTPYKLGNDILTDGSDIYRVTTYDAIGGTPGISFNVYYNGNNYNNVVPLFSYGPNVDYFYSDVCLVKDPTSPNDIVAVVVMYVYDNVNLTGAWIYVDLFWQTASGPYQNSFQPNSTWILQTGAQGTGVNIDGDDQGNFAIAFDDGGTNIWLVTGTANNFFSNGGVTIDNLGTPTHSTVYAYYPDITIQHNNGTDRIYLSFYNYSTNIQVNEYIYSEVQSNSITTATPNYISATFGSFGYPRIASPVSSSGSSPEWSVVVEEVDNGRTQFDIEAFNSIIGTSTALTFFSSSEVSFNPVIAYDAGGNVWIGCVLDDNALDLAGHGGGVFPIVGSCDQYGVLGSNYYELPNSISSSTAFIPFAIATRNSGQIYASYYDSNSAGNLYSKWQPTASFPGFKVSQNNYEISFLKFLAGTLSDNEMKTSFTLFVYNSSGQIILKESGNGYKMQQAIQEDLRNLPLSLYLVNLISDDGKIALSGKLVSRK